jgi:hypothetical protein
MDQQAISRGTVQENLMVAENKLHEVKENLNKIENMQRELLQKKNDLTVRFIRLESEIKTLADLLEIKKEAQEPVEE